MSSKSPRKKILLLFSIGRLETMLAKGNVWYVQHYESYFDLVYVAYLFGDPMRIKRRGHTVLISLGLSGKLGNLMLAPWKLFVLAKRVHSGYYLTADIFFSWWTGLLLRIGLDAKIALMPVCMPIQIYANATGSITRYLPIFIEKIFTRFSFAAANRVLTGKNIFAYVEWLSTLSATKDKLVVIDTLPEELPSIDFYSVLERIRYSRTHAFDQTEKILLYVGRLHSDKLLFDVLDMARQLMDMGVSFKVVFVGDGDEKVKLELRALELGIFDRVMFEGAKQSRELAQYYAAATAFISPLTGTALREAALSGVPIVAYDCDWVKGVFEDNHTALLVEYRNTSMLAKKVAELLTSPQLQATLSTNAMSLANLQWGTSSARLALEQAFGAAPACKNIQAGRET